MVRAARMQRTCRLATSREAIYSVQHWNGRFVPKGVAKLAGTSMHRQTGNITIRKARLNQNCLLVLV
jgi:hypothetical protein